MQTVASVFAVELSVVNIRDADAIERGIEKVAGSPNSALLVTASAPGERTSQPDHQAGFAA